MEQVLKNTSIIGTSISIQLEQWQLKRQLMELHQRAISAQQQLANSPSSHSLVLAAPSAATPTDNHSPSNRTIYSPLNVFYPVNNAGLGIFSSHGGNFTHHSNLFFTSADATNHDVDQQSLENIMGPARETDQVLLCMTLIYSLILFSGIIGNTLTLFVIWRHPRMHAGATNYYLASLAVSDLISLVFGLPLEMYQLFQSHPYPLPEYACVARGWLTEMATNSSVLCILLFSFERYLAVVHPFQIRLRSRVYRALPLVVCAWLIAFGAAAPIALQLGIVYKVVNQFTGVPRAGTQLCIIKHPLPHSFQLSTVFLFVVPMLIIIVFHVVIVIKLVHASRSQGSLNRATSSEGGMGNGGAGGESGRRIDPTLRFSRGRRAVLRMLASVALAFFICYAPFHSQRLLASYLSNIVGNDPSAFAAYKTYLFISGILYYSASTVNPILYNILSIRFRRAFLDALVGCIPGCGGRGGSPAGSPNTRLGGGARSQHHFQQLRRQYTNTGTNECNSIAGYDTDGYSLSSRVIALNKMNNKNSTISNGTVKNRGAANGATVGQHHRRVAGPCPSSASNYQIPNSNLLSSNTSVVWRSNSFSSQSEFEELGTFTGGGVCDENASADYSTTQSLEFCKQQQQQREQQRRLSSSQRRRILMETSRNNSAIIPHHQNGHRASQRSNSHQPHHQFTNVLSPTAAASQRDRAVSFESATAEIVDSMRMRTPPFRLSPSEFEMVVAQQQLDFDPRMHRESNASMDSILVAKVTLSQRSSPVTETQKGVGTNLPPSVGSSLQTTPSHCSTTDRYFLGDTLTLKTEQLKQRVAVKKAARKALRETQQHRNRRQSITKPNGGHHSPARNGGVEFKTQQSVDSVDGSKCGQWMNRAAARKQPTQQRNADKKHRKQAVASLRNGQNLMDEKKLNHVVVVFAPPATEILKVEPTNGPATASITTSTENIFGSNSVFDYADDDSAEEVDDEQSATLIPLATPAAAVANTTTTTPAAYSETAEHSNVARTLAVKTSSGNASAPPPPVVNIVISPPSISSRSDSIHSGSNFSSSNGATQV